MSIASDMSIIRIDLSYLPVSQESVVIVWFASKSSFEECYVEDRAVEVDKLEQITFQCESIIIICLGSEDYLVNV